MLKETHFKLFTYFTVSVETIRIKTTKDQQMEVQ